MAEPPGSSAASGALTRPVLRDAPYLKGFLVSIDAIGCQRYIAARIVAKGGGYLLAVKGSSPSCWNESKSSPPPGERN